MIQDKKIFFLVSILNCNLFLNQSIADDKDNAFFLIQFFGVVQRIHLFIKRCSFLF